MYQQTPAPTPSRWPASSAGWRAVSPNVWALGITSLVTDVSSEMVTSVLPVYVVLHLQLTPMAFGAVDGLYQAAAAAVRLGSGAVADRWQHHKAVATAGYALSAVAKLGYVAAASWPLFLAVVTADRLGKGVRTAPRDALIAAASTPQTTATSFGVHRALDAAGTALGPLATFALLTAAPGRFDQVFVASFVAAVVGVAALVLLVDAPPRAASNRPARSLVAHATDALAAPGFGRVALAALLVSAATVSDGLLYLVLQQQAAFEPSRVTLLFVGTPLAYFLLAGPFGVLADRRGTRRLFLAGHLALGLVYALLWRGASGPASIVAAVVLLGAYYAATDGVLAAMASRVLPEPVRATGLGLLATGTTAARAGAALAFGAAWTWSSAPTALAWFGLALLAGVGTAAWLLRETPGMPSPVAGGTA
jgi:MFS family permease